DPTKCPQPWSDSSTPFCTFVEWHRIERAELLGKGQVGPMSAGSTLDLITVARPPNADRLIEFDSYQPGADLILGRVSLGPLGAMDPASATSVGSLLDKCVGVMPSRANVDVRGPDVSYDANKVAFAMRLSMADTLDLYEVTLDAQHACTKVTNGNAQSRNG